MFKIARVAKCLIVKNAKIPYFSLIFIFSYEEVERLDLLIRQTKFKPMIIYLIHFYENELKLRERRTVFIKNERLEQCKQLAIENIKSIFRDEVTIEDNWTENLITSILSVCFF